MPHPIPGYENVAVTQIISFLFNEAPTSALQDSGQFGSLLNLFEQSPGLQRIYWGRSHEHPEYAQLHVIRQSLSQHHAFLGSKTYKKNFLTQLQRLTNSSRAPIIRHAQLKSFSGGPPFDPVKTPFTGTAIYLNTSDAWDEGAWPCWTHVVRHVDGCLGGYGGPIFEPVETVVGLVSEMVTVDQHPEELRKYQRCNIVYVGWETTEQHDHLHHTKHFEKYGVILRIGNEGFAEYGHICFEGSREYTSREAKL